MGNATNYDSLEGIAIIGMTGRFPKAKNLQEFWQNLCNGEESISVFTDEELIASGIEPALLNDPHYVKASAVLADIDLFDASFFGLNPKEAEVTDPQHRLFLECAWEALENAGYDSTKSKSRIGVYAGASLNNYLSFNLNHDQIGSANSFQKLIGNDKDFLTTRVSYKLNLHGPSITVQTACSTSLVAISLACQSLLNYQCDIALTGGVSIRIPQKSGYIYQEGGILSPDGHCRAFDSKAQGTIIGNGVGVVVLKRLKDAIADGDCIHAVIKGAAINNDGSLKVGYTAPSVDGQASVIAEAMMLAGVEPETVNYIETHGTGTVLGDPIEIAALSQVVGSSTNKRGFCAISSLKTNIGHLDAAAGVAGLIKTVLALKHQLIPPSLNFEQPNPQIDFASSPFYVNTALSQWKAENTPRRAGVSSLGIGGTNAHVILEEAPVVQASSPSRPWQLLVLSAKTDSALETATANLLQHLKQHPDLNLADVAYTLQVGRREFNHRRVLVCRNLEDAADSQRVFTHSLEAAERPIVFMFPGQGAQYVDMGKELYQTEPIFREQVDLCCQLLQPDLGLDLRSLIYPSEFESKAAAEKLQQTNITQPALFVIEYALAQLWMSWGVSPQTMIGHSIGEYVAATLADVMSVKDALFLVAARGRLMQQLPPGAMLSVPLPEAEVRGLLNENLSLAASNAPALCVVSGTDDAIDAFQNQLQGVECRRLHTSHAFHSSMMEPILEPFQKEVNKVKLYPPKIPFISNITGTWITADQATDPNYWTRHLRHTVRFSAGISALLQEPNRILLEVGPGHTLSTFAKKHSQGLGLPSLRHPQEKHSDVAFLINTLGKIWLFGVQVDWSGFYAREHRHRLPLPTYPFERQRYWIEPQKLLSGQFQSRPITPELWKSVVEVGQTQASHGISEFDNHTYLANKRWLERLCTAYMNLALKRLGVFRNPSQKYSLEELFDQCQIIPRYRQLLCRWLDVLVEQGQMQQSEGFFSNLSTLPTDSINTLIEEFRTRWADTPQQRELVQNCGENLADVLTGKKEPLELYAATLAKTGEISRQNLPDDIYYNAIIRSSLEVVAKSLPPNINLRILEIGGGTGIATAELLPILPFKQTKYTFTDVGSVFLTEAKKKFSAYPFVEYNLLDIEQPPTDQGYSRHSFDVIVAVNVLHVTQNIGKTLEHIRSLLAPEGLLLIQEITQPQLEFDITDGLLMNPIEDVQRSKGNPFLSREQWQETLDNHGFVKVAAFSETDAFGQHIFLAQTSTSVALPTVFSATIEADKKSDIADWFYIPSWKRSKLLQPFKSTNQIIQPECWLIFIDNCGLGDRIVKQLELLGHKVVTLISGEQFTNESKSSPESQRHYAYTLNPRQKDDYDTLRKELCALDLIPKKIVHLWSVTPVVDVELEIKGVKKAQEKGFYSLLFLTQVLREQNFSEELQITVVSNNMQAVTGEETLFPEKATILGLVKVIPQEYQNIYCRSIDVVLPLKESWQEEKLIEGLLTELTVQTSESIIAYRGIHRWVQTFEPVRLEEVVAEIPQLSKGGVYLIVGGLGSLGLVLAKHLAQTSQAKLILTGRSSFPVRDKWSQWLVTHDERDDISYKIRKLLEIEAFGAEVLIVSADTANLEQMQQAIAQAEEQFGQLNGVIHCVATSITERMRKIQTTDEIECERQFQGKIYGLLVLEKVLQGKNLDFCFIISSLASIFGGVGNVAYSAANLFLDTFVHQHNQINHVPWVSINWDGRVPLQHTENELMPLLSTNPELTMTLTDDVKVFGRILSWQQFNQVIVSTRNLQPRIEQWTKEKFVNIKPTIKVNSSSLHSRPNLQTNYFAPRNEVEQTLTNIWQEILGIEQVGIHDNFFKLGGDSLSGVTLINQCQKQLGQSIPIAVMFEAPTIAELANYFNQQFPKAVVKNVSSNGKTDQEMNDTEEGFL